MRLMLALLGAVCCIVLGRIASNAIRAREKCLDGWRQALIRMESAVNQGGLPLTELMQAGNVPCLLQAAQALEENPALSPDELLEILPMDGCLTLPEWEMATAMIKGLFSPDRQRQLQSIRHAKEQLDHAFLLYREAAERNIRLYQGLGWLSGAAAFILLC